MKLQRSALQRRAAPRPGFPARIALVTSHFPPSTGGLERHVAALAQAMASRGIAVDIIVPGESTTTGQYGEQPMIRVRQFRIVVGAPRYSFSPGVWRYLHRAAGAYDLVHAHNY